MSEQQDRTTVRTYVPQYQADEWASEAESLDMSLSEFVRSMVQAGRKGFDIGSEGPGEPTNSEEPHLPPSNPGGSGLEDRILAVLDSSGVADWDALVSELSGDFEERLEDAIEALEDRNEIRYAPRDGGYVRRGDD